MYSVERTDWMQENWSRHMGCVTRRDYNFFIAVVIN